MFLLTVDGCLNSYLLNGLGWCHKKPDFWVMKVHHLASDTDLVINQTIVPKTNSNIMNTLAKE